MVVNFDELLGKGYNIDEAAELLGISTEATRRLVRAGLLKARRPPGRKSYVVTGEEIVLYLNGGPTPAMKARDAALVTRRLGTVLEAASPKPKRR